LPERVISTVWEGESRILITLAFIAVFMQHVVWGNASKMAEAQRETIRIQKLNTLVVFVHFIVVILLLIFEKLAIPFLLLAIVFEWAIAGFYASKMYKGFSDDEETNKNDIQDTPLSVWSEFWFYCLPFIPYAWLSFVHDLADRWMLQHWGGSSEQAYYAIARQFSLVALLATTSILSILWKEIAEAYHRGDLVKVQLLYQKTTKGLYFIAAFIAGIVFPWATEILQLTVGEAYIGGGVTLMIMLFYPAHQALGQITGSTLLATGHSRLQVKMGLIFMAVSLVVAYYVLAPESALYPGLGLASKGLAWKMLLLQIVQINVWLFVISKIFDWHYDWSYQFIVLGIVLITGWIVKIIVMKIYMPILVSIMIAGFLYSLIVLAILYAFPGIAGLSKDEYKSSFISLKKILLFRDE